MRKAFRISNRNIRIITEYVRSRIGHYEGIFDGIEYPIDRYSSPEEYFLNEDEWTTYENFINIFQRAEKMVGEKNFYFNCGLSSAYLRSWGRVDYFSRIFLGPDEGYRRLPIFNRQFVDTKDIEIILPPEYDRDRKLVRTILKIEYQKGFDPNKDFIGDRYTTGIICSIPVIWGLRPAIIKKLLRPYDPEIFFNNDPEFTNLNLNVHLEGNELKLTDPATGERISVGRKILLKPSYINNKEVYLGEYVEREEYGENLKEAILITRTVQSDKNIILKRGEIYKAPYFILDINYEKFSFIQRLKQLIRLQRSPDDIAQGLIETINLLRNTIEARDEAYARLKEAQERLENYAKNLEKMVQERTIELKSAKDELEVLNRELQNRVEKQVTQLKRYDELRRYLSPKLADIILSRGEILGSTPKRKMMTVLFSDIRNFSAITDSLEPEEIFHLLDRYLSEMTGLIHKYDGTLNKIMGDGMLVFFGDPVSVDNHAQKAVMLAIDMQKSVSILKKEWQHFGHNLELGIGINTGFMTVGNIGSESHKDYTVIGNQVNLAARLVSLAKPGEILISQRTYSRVKDMVDVEEAGIIKLKGLHHPVRIYKIKY